MTIFTPGITRLQDTDDLTIFGRIWSVADDPEGIESTSTKGLEWGGGTTRVVERGMVRLGGSLKREPFALWRCFEAELKNEAGAGGFGGSEWIEVVVFDSIWRNFASIIAILLSVLILRVN